MQLLNVLTLTNKLVWRPLMIKFMSLRPTPAQQTKMFESPNQNHEIKSKSDQKN